MVNEMDSEDTKMIKDYQEGFVASGLRNGDPVVITQELERHDPRWANIWPAFCEVGQVGVISDEEGYIDSPYGMIVKFRSENDEGEMEIWQAALPYFALERIDRMQTKGKGD
jgi:hypothetical protein